MRKLRKKRAATERDAVVAMCDCRGCTECISCSCSDPQLQNVMSNVNNVGSGSSTNTTRMRAQG
jgi:hypothetical protein